MSDLKECDRCESTNLQYVKYKMKNDVEILRLQCLDCGRLLTENYKKNSVEDFHSLPCVDKEARQSYMDKRIRQSEIRKMFEGERSVSFSKSREYYNNVYLKSLEWKKKRDLVMDYFNGKCQKCSNYATDIHHVTYDNIFIEKFDDLIPLCRSCHNKEHQSNPAFLPEIEDDNVNKLSLKSIREKHEIIRR